MGRKKSWPFGQNWGKEAYERGRKHGANICRLHGKKTARKIVRYKPQTDYERGKIDYCRDFLQKED